MNYLNIQNTISGVTSVSYMALVTISAVTMLSSSACTKKEKASMPPPAHQTMMPAHEDIQMPSAERMKIVIPPEIKDKWRGVVITVLDKKSMNSRDYNIRIGDKFSVPGSKIDVQTIAFLPDFQIIDNVYSTASAELNNPAIQIEVSEEGKEIFKGWLFQRYPSVHPFKHEIFSLTFKEPVSSL